MTWIPDPDMGIRAINKELSIVAADFEKKFKNGQSLDSKMRLSEYVENYWLKRKEKEVEPTTYTRYKGMLKRILPALGHYRLENIQPGAIYAFYDDLYEEKREDIKYKPTELCREICRKDYTRPEFAEKCGIGIDKNKQMMQKEMEISLKAGELVGKLYDAILKQYKDPESPETLKSLNVLCVRLVFCLYAEDAGIFGTHEMFGQYLAQFPAKEIREKLIKLFEVLDTKPEDRDPYMDDDLAAFPYVNGGLFAEKNIEIPRFTDEIVDLLINKASAGFDWSDISPTIFGAVFESTLNPETRRSGGMHYTSIENIHKVIDPLFLDDLKTEFSDIMEGKQLKVRNRKLEEFREKLASLTFLDPACGSGNFLTETYLSLRRLENEAIAAMLGDDIMFADTSSLSTIKVSIGQFYGIEINDFAVVVAKTALWIAEAQIAKLEDIPDGCSEIFPFSTIKKLKEEFIETVRDQNAPMEYGGSWYL